jgi:tetratricopeptide (TPR) repeat protein
MARGDYRTAIEMLRRALTEDPLSASAHALLALCLVDAKRLYAAEHEATLALELEPELDTAHLAMGYVRLGQRKLAEVERHLEELSRSDPGSQDAFRLRALLARAHGRPNDAIAVLEQARAADPEDMRTLVALGHAYIAVRRLGEADEVSLEVLHANAASLDGLVLRGWVLLLQGATADAREHALLAIRQVGGTGAPLHLLVATKARSNLFLGVWWRFNAWLTTMSGTRRALVLIALFVLYRLAAIVSAQIGFAALSDAIVFAWVGFVAYTWAAIPVFQRMLQRELGTVRLRAGF